MKDEIIELIQKDLQINLKGFAGLNNVETVRKNMGDKIVELLKDITGVQCELVSIHQDEKDPSKTIFKVSPVQDYIKISINLKGDDNNG